MKLDEYVRRTLVDISKGVTKAKEESSVWIAPGYVDGEKVFSEQLVQFEIIVSVEKEGSGGIEVLSFGELKGTYSAEHSHKISFNVPVYFQAPTSNAPEKQ